MGLISLHSDSTFWEFIHTYCKLKIFSLNFINAIMLANISGDPFKACTLSSPPCQKLYSFPLLLSPKICFSKPYDHSAKV